MKKLSQNYLTHTLGVGALLVPCMFSDFFIDPFSPTKWVGVHLVSIILFVFLVLQEKITIPVLPKNIRLTLVGMIGIYFFSILINFQASYISQYADWLSFIFISLASYQVFNNPKTLKKFYSYLAIGGVIVSLIGYWQIYCFEVPSSSFGYPNLTAQYLGILIVFSIFMAFSGELSKKSRTSLLIIICTVFFPYFYILNTRASYIAFGVSTIIWVFLKPWDRLTHRNIAILTVTILTLSFLFLRNENLESNSTKQENKRKSAEIRLNRWGNSVYMALDNPLGVGPGQYEFGYIPYSNKYKPDPEANENLVIKSPHNGYLEATIENGWLFTLAFLLLCFSLFKRIKIGEITEAPNLIKISFAGIIYIMVNALFSFPLENAVPFFMTAVFVGFIFHFFQSSQKDLNKLGLAPLGVVLFVASLRFGVSKHFERTYAWYFEKQKEACLLLPENWRACMQAVKLGIKQEKYHESIEIAEGMIKRQEYTFPALKLLAIAYHGIGMKEESCRALEKYLKLYPKASFVKEFEENCRGTRFN